MEFTQYNKVVQKRVAFIEVAFCETTKYDGMWLVTPYISQQHVVISVYNIKMMDQLILMTALSK